MIDGSAFLLLRLVRGCSSGLLMGLDAAFSKYLSGRRVASLYIMSFFSPSLSHPHSHSRSLSLSLPKGSFTSSLPTFSYASCHSTHFVPIPSSPFLY